VLRRAIRLHLERNPLVKSIAFTVPTMAATT
jgi:hypothetical protein